MTSNKKVYNTKILQKKTSEPNWNMIFFYFLTIPNLRVCQMLTTSALQCPSQQPNLTSLWKIQCIFYFHTLLEGGQNSELLNSYTLLHAP